MRRLFRIALVTAVVCCLALSVAAADRAVKSFERPERSFDRAEHFRQMAALQQRLRDAAVELPAAQPFEVVVTRAELDGIREDRAMEQKLRVGLVKELSIPMDFSRERLTPGQIARHDVLGAVRGRADGGFDWSGAIRSQSATASRIHFTGVDLPDGAALYVYTREGMAFGPYTGRGPNGTGEFWSNTVAGGEVMIQLHAAGGAPRFTIAGFGHLTDAFQLGQNLRPVANAGNVPCSFNASCVVDAACVAANAAVNVAEDAVAHMLFASGAYLYICSGGLVADSDTATNIPYFMTANHCISRASEASSLETFFFYRAPSCGSCPDPGAASTTGASIVAGSKTGDFTLLRLSQNAPSGAAFLGWNSTPIATVNNAALYRLSHPKGAPQSYSAHVVDTSKGTCRSWPRGSWIYSTDILGATEGGSSGSPVVNAAGQLVGQLSGGCGFNVNDVCDTASNATVDGAFAAYYSSVSQFLGAGSGGGGCTDADGDGICASAGDCNDNNPNIYPGANDTKGKTGRDGIDNDCDGTPDA